MAQYPDLPHRQTIKPIGGTKTYYSDDGSVRGVNTESVNAVEIRLVHPLITRADVDTVLAFYDTNKGSKITWTDPLTGDIYTGIIVSRPEARHYKGQWWDVQTIIRGNK